MTEKRRKRGRQGRDISSQTERGSRLERGRKRKLKLLTAGCVILAVLAIGGLVSLVAMQGDAAGDEALANAKPAAENAPLKADLSILCVGDVMAHDPQLRAQYDSATDKYNFDNNFKHVKKYIEAADLAICNVETTFAGKPYTGFPMFSSPDSMASAIKNAGFDVGITSNNHMADKGLDGILRTLRVLEKKGIATVGSVQEESEPRYLIQDVNGVKVGIVAYTYETGSGEGSTSLNGNLLSDETAAHINSFNFNTLEEDVPRIKEAIDAARAEGAQIIIAYYHWGEEYQQSANENQKKLAQETVNMGADIIFASHPHVLQETDYLTAESSGKKVPVFYSMGNFISNQRSETLGNRYTEQGVMAMVNLTYQEDKGITSIEMDAVPTWVDRYYSGGKQVYEIIPLDDDLQENDTLPVSGHLSRAQQAKEDANGTLGIHTKEN